MATLAGQSPWFAPGPPARPGEAYQPIVAFLKGAVAGRTVLDLGGGQGAYALELSRAGCEVCVADVDPAALAVAREQGLSTRLLEPDAELGAGIVDTVIMIEVLEHVPDPAQLLRQALGAARQRVLFTVPCTQDFPLLFSYGLSYAHIAVSDHLWHFSDGDLETMLKATGRPYQLTKGDPLFPHAALHVLRKSFRWRWLGQLFTLPLRLADRLGWIRRRVPSRYYCIITSRSPSS